MPGRLAVAAIKQEVLEPNIKCREFTWDPAVAGTIWSHDEYVYRGRGYASEHRPTAAIRDLVTGNIVQGLEYAVDRISTYFWGLRSPEGWVEAVMSPDENKRKMYTHRGHLITLPHYTDRDAADAFARQACDIKILVDTNGGIPFVLEFGLKHGLARQTTWLCFTKQQRKDPQYPGNVCTMYRDDPFRLENGDEIRILSSTDIGITRPGRSQRRYKILSSTKSFYNGLKTLLYDPYEFTITWRDENDACSTQLCYKEYSVNLKEPDIIKLLSINGISDNLKRVILALI